MWLQVFVFLLRLVHPDARKALVRESLDVLTPFLAKRRQEAGVPHSLIETLDHESATVDAYCEAIEFDVHGLHNSLVVP